MKLFRQSGMAWALTLLMLTGLVLVGCSDLERTRRAAEQGDAIAQDRFGNMYSKGVGVPLDYAQAATWYSKAAEQGFAPAQASLAFLYYKGEGVQKNDVKALAWLSLAAAQGKSKDAEGARDLVAMGLTPEQLSLAQALANELQGKISRKKP